MKQYITTNPIIMGGQPCIVGTRIPVRLILIRLKQGYTLKKLQQMYDWVPLATFEGVLEELVQLVEEKGLQKKPSQQRKQKKTRSVVLATAGIFKTDEPAKTDKELRILAEEA